MGILEDRIEAREEVPKADDTVPSAEKAISLSLSLSLSLSPPGVKEEAERNRLSWKAHQKFREISYISSFRQNEDKISSFWI